MGTAKLEKLRTRPAFECVDGTRRLDMTSSERDALFAHIGELTAMLRKIGPEWYREYAGTASAAEDYATIQRLTATADTHSAA